MKPLVRLLAAVLVSFCSSTQALIITLEPDDFAAGQDLSEAGEGARLYTFTNTGGAGFTLTPVYAQNNPNCTTDPLSCDAFSGTQGFGNSPDPDSGLYGDWFEFSVAAQCWRWTNVGGLGNPCAGPDVFSAMLIHFDRPSEFVQISGAYLSDPPSLYAFDAAFNFVGSCGYGDGTNCSGLATMREPTYQYNLRTVSIVTAMPLVSYVIAGGVSGNSSLDRLSYSVPEPGTLALLTVGLLGIAMRRRRGD